jgi:L-fucose mutarotase
MLKYTLTHPGILAILGGCGHGDQIAIVDSNYPAHAQRLAEVPFLSVNVTQGLVDTPTMLRLVTESMPIEALTIPCPAESLEPGSRRPVHESMLQVSSQQCASADVCFVPPQDFYALTSRRGLALMIGTGERSHFGSVLVTFGYLPEL